MSKQVVINNQLTLPIKTFSDKLSAYNTEQIKAISMVIEVNLEDNAFPYEHPTDLFEDLAKYYDLKSITSLSILKDGVEVYNTNKYDHIINADIQLNPEDELICQIFLEKMLDNK